MICQKKRVRRTFFDTDWTAFALRNFQHLSFLTHWPQARHSGAVSLASGTALTRWSDQYFIIITILVSQGQTEDSSTIGTSAHWATFTTRCFDYFSFFTVRLYARNFGT